MGLKATATSVFETIRKSVNLGEGITNSRPLFQERLIDFLLVIGTGILFIISISFPTNLGVLKEIVIFIHPSADIKGAIIWDQFALILPILMTIGTFILLYKYLPNPAIHFEDIILGCYNSCNSL